jgi:hypothetical protein
MNHDARSKGKVQTQAEDEPQTPRDSAHSQAEIDDETLARPYKGFAEEDRALAADGLAEYARSLGGGG